MGAVLTRRPILEVSDDSLNRGLVYRFLATEKHLKNHRWYALDQENRRVKRGGSELVAYAYTNDAQYSSAEYNPFTPCGVAAPFGSADSKKGFAADVNRWKVNNLTGAIEHGVGTGDFAICVTINPHTISTAFYALWANGAFVPALYQCTTSGGGAWGMFWGPSTTISANSVLTTNTWWHLVATRVNGTIYFYKNGRPDGSSANTTSMADADHVLGSNRIDATANYFRGRLGEVAFYNRGISASEAKALHDDWRRGYPRLIRWDGLATKRSVEAGDVFSGTASLIAGGAEFAASSTFTAPSYTATADVASGGAEVSASATFTNPTYTATSDLISGGSELSASAAVTNPSYTATADLISGGAEFDADAIFQLGPETYTATALLLAGGAEFDASGTVVNPTYTASAAVISGGAEFAATAEFATVSFLASAAVETGGATVTVAATFVTPVYTASVDLVAGGAEFASTATFTPLTFTATTSLVAGGAEFSAAATFTAPIYVAAGFIEVTSATMYVSESTGVMYVSEAEAHIALL